MTSNQDLFEFILQKHRFRLDSNPNVYFSLLMDNNCGIQFLNNGNVQLTADNGYIEVLGEKIKTTPGACNPAKIIYAKNGDIILDALNGDIVLRGSNIHIESTDPSGGEIVIRSNKTVQIDSSNTNIQGDTLSVASTLSSAIAGGFKESHGEINNESTAGTDIIKSSYYGKILSAIKRLKDFFNSICGP
jgi:hypothetical protein